MVVGLRAGKKKRAKVLSKLSSNLSHVSSYLNNVQNVTFLFEQEAESISWFKMKNASEKCVLLIGDSPTSVYIGRHVIHVMKWTRPLPSVLHIASYQKLDGGKAWEQG